MNRLNMIGMIFAGLTAACLFLFLLPGASQAQVDSELPPRPTPDPLSSTADSSSAGSTIMLSVSAADVESLDADDWAIVQWQDAHGGWNNVAGWQGNLAYDASAASWEVIWWVDRGNFGETSFRWAVYSDHTMMRLEATSPMFDLPENRMQRVVVGLEN